MKTGIGKDIRKALAKEHACYVLITCAEPSEDGQMNVEMTYEGDPTLAAYMLHSAQAFVDDEDGDGEGVPIEESICDHSIRQIR